MVEGKVVGVKVGSSSYFDDNGQFNKEIILLISKQLVELKRQGHHCFLVSSGAIASCPIKGLSRNASAGVGQNVLISYYREVMGYFKTFPLQMLLTDQDLKSKRTKKTIVETFGKNIIPIINGNDTVDDAEINALVEGADNDRLFEHICAGVLTDMVDAAVIGFDQPGVKDKNGKIIRRIASADIGIIMNLAIGGSKTGHGPEGMKTKIGVLGRLSEKGVYSVLAPAREENFILRAVNKEKDFGTVFIR